MKKQHTPTPRGMRIIKRKDGGFCITAQSDVPGFRKIIAMLEQHRYAELIVRAVNAHEDLVKALAKAKKGDK